MSKKEPKPTAVEQDAAYLQLLCAAVTGVAASHPDATSADISDQAAEIADDSIEKWKLMYSVHRDKA
jgi:hypothetical protein